MAADSPARPGFAANTLWTWTSVAISFATALVVSPLMIHRLGSEAYGLWALAFGVTEYYSIADLGVRSAVLKYVAHYWTLGDREQLNQTLNSAFAYFGAMGLLILAVALVIAPFGPRLWVVSPGMASTFVFVLGAIGASFALIFALGWLNAVLESVQRFDISYRIIITANLFRVIGTIWALLAGYGLITVVVVMVLSRALQGVMVIRAFRRHFTDWRWSAADVTRGVFRQFLSFSMFTLPSNASLVFIEHGPAVIIGHHLPAAYVGYYVMPRRLITIVMQLVHGVGAVTTARSAELAAKGDTEGLIRLGVSANRYCLLLFLPAAVFLTLYGGHVFELWLTPEFAQYSAPVLSVFAIGFLLADAGQFNSSAMLYGLARHQLYSAFLVGEAVVSVFLVYRFADLGHLVYAAVGSAAAMVVSRGLLTPALLCRHLKFPVTRYLWEIAARPLAVGMVVGVLMELCRRTWLPGTTYVQIGVAIALTSIATFLFGARVCLFPEHRGRALELVRDRAPWAESAVRMWLGLPRLAGEPV